MAAAPSPCAPRPAPRAGAVDRARRLLSRAAPLAAVLAGPAVAAAPARAVQPAAPPAGELTGRLVSVADSSLSYALLLPPGYTGETPRPLLLVLDPRGRAVTALRIFRRPAERLGWIVMSSHDTRSDTSDATVNERALRAMLADAGAHLAVDDRRIYLAGFSGTARLGWLFARGLSDHVAGLVGVGAGLPGGFRGLLLADGGELPATFSFWGGSGVLDFNHREVRRLDEELDDTDLPHRVEHYGGGHAWLPPGHAARALDWLELQAMRQGLAPVEPAFVDSLHRVALAEARTRETARRPAAALRAWRRVVEDFEGLRPVEEARERVAALRERPEVRRRAERLERLDLQHDAFSERLREVLERLSDGTPAPEVDEIAAELGLDELRRRAGDGADSLGALAAGRLLELAYVQTSFYVPRRVLADGEPERALAALEVAERARPGRPRVRWQRARALTLARRPDEAFEELAALPTGFPPSLLADDPWLADLTDDPRWEATLERLRPAAPP